MLLKRFVFLFFLVLLCGNALGSVTFYCDVDFYGDELTVNFVCSGVTLSYFEVGDNYCVFDSINLSVDTTVIVNVSQVNSNPYGSVNAGDTVLRFNATTSGSNVIFNFNGNITNGVYNEYQDSVIDKSSQDDGFTFTVSSWSSVDVEVRFSQVSWSTNPIVTTNASSSITFGGATLNGYVVNTTGEATCAVRFEYGTTTGYGTNTSDQNIAEGNTFSAVLSELEASTTYHYRAYIENSSGANSVGEDMTFTTLSDLIILRPEYWPFTSFDRHGDTENYKCVDEIDTDENTTYVYHNGTSESEQYNLENKPSNISSLSPIIKVSFCARGINTWQIGKIVLGFVGNGGIALSDILSLPFTYSNVYYNLSSNPRTGNNWTWTDINNMRIYLGIIGKQHQDTEVRVTQYFVTVYYLDSPSVTTNISTGIQENNVTLNGYLLNTTNRFNTCNVFFQYGETTSYGTNTAQQVLSDNTEFEHNLTGINPGTLYHYRAVANTTDQVFDYGDDMTVQTKPEGPVGLTLTEKNEGTIHNFSWTKGDGALRTVILHKTGSYPITQTDGTVIYNDTGTAFDYDGFSFGYYNYYRSWSFSNTTFSDNYTSSTTTSFPAPPANASSDYNINTRVLNLSWDRGTGSDREIVVRQNNSYSSSISDGVIVYNYTDTFYNFTTYDSYYYTVFSFNSTTHYFSPTGLSLPWGAVNISVYNETSPWEKITNFGLLISNQEGTSSYQNKTCDNPHVLDLHDIPYGDDTVIVINATNYLTRTYYKDLNNNSFYNLSFYLPPIEVSVDPGSGDPGGSGDNYTTTRTYFITVVDGFTFPLSDVKVVISRFMNNTGNYEEIESDITDGNGEAQFKLIPNVKYRVVLTKSGYAQVGDKFWFPDPDYYGIYYPKKFVMEIDPSETENNSFWDVCSFTANMYDNSTLHVDFLDSDSATDDFVFYVYEVFNDTATLLTTKTGSLSDYDFWVTNVNTSRSHRVVLFLNHTSFDSFSMTIMVAPLHTPDKDTEEMESDLTDTLGDNPLGWVNMLFLFVPILVLLVVFAPYNAGVGVIGSGLYVGFASIFITVPVNLTVLVPFVIAMGVILIFVKKRRENI